MKNKIITCTALYGLLIATHAALAMDPQKPTENDSIQSSEIKNETQDKKKYHISEIRTLNPNSNFVPMFIPVDLDQLDDESIAALNRHFASKNNSTNNNDPELHTVLTTR